MPALTKWHTFLGFGNWTILCFRLFRGPSTKHSCSYWCIKCHKHYAMLWSSTHITQSFWWANMTKPQKGKEKKKGESTIRGKPKQNLRNIINKYAPQSCTSVSHLPSTFQSRVLACGKHILFLNLIPCSLFYLFYFLYRKQNLINKSWKNTNTLNQTST